MFRHLVAAWSTVLLSLVVIPSGAAPRAQTIPAQQNAVLESMRALIVRTIGAQEKTVEVSFTRNIVTVSRVNSNMNESSHGGRNNEASAIASVVSKAIANKSEFGNINTIRVQYLMRGESAADIRVIDTVDFRKDLNGVFQPHAT